MGLSIPLVSGLLLLAARANAQQQCTHPSGRYWRLYQLEPTNGGSSGYSWHITELRLFDSNGQSLAIAACDSQYLRSGNGGTGWRDGTLGGAYDCRNAYDGGSSSYSPRRENQIEGGMMAVDLGATYTVSTVEMTSLSPGYSPLAWKLQSSDDGETWVDVSDVMRPGTSAPLETTWPVWGRPVCMDCAGEWACTGACDRVWAEATLCCHTPQSGTGAACPTAPPPDAADCASGEGACVLGCTDEGATNHDETATSDDGSCVCDPTAAFRGPGAYTAGSNTAACPACSGDMDGDMVVGTRDLLLLLSDFDLTDCRLISDANGDCVVNTPDLLALLAAFGTDCMCNGRNGARPAGFPNQACVCNAGLMGDTCGIAVTCPALTVEILGPGGIIEYSDGQTEGVIADTVDVVADQEEPAPLNPCPAGTNSAGELTVFDNSQQCNVDHTIPDDILNALITGIRVVRLDGEEASWNLPQAESLSDIFHQDWHGIAGETDQYKLIAGTSSNAAENLYVFNDHDSANYAPDACPQATYVGSGRSQLDCQGTSSYGIVSMTQTSALIGDHGSCNYRNDWGWIVREMYATVPACESTSSTNTASYTYGSVAEFHCPGVDDSHGTQTCGLDGQFTGDTPILCSSPTSCREAKEIDPSAETGVYTITRADGSEEEMYCDMETDGGGWTLTFLLRHVNNMGENYFPHILEDTGAWPLSPGATPNPEWVTGPSPSARQQYWEDTGATEWRASNYDGEERVVDTKSDNGFSSGNSAVCAAAGNVGGSCGSGFHNAVFATGVALQDFCKGVCYTEGDAVNYYQVGDMNCNCWERVEIGTGWDDNNPQIFGDFVTQGTHAVMWVR